MSCNPPHPPVDRSALCHELTTALTVIHVRAQLLQRQLGRGSVAANGNYARIEQGLAAILEASRRLYALSNELCAADQTHPGQPTAPTG